LFLCVDFAGLVFFFFVPLLLEVSLSDTTALSFGFLVGGLWLEAVDFFFVEEARGAPLVFFELEDLSIDCWRRSMVFFRSLVASVTPLVISDLMMAGSMVGSSSRRMAVSAVAF
jgi:hypothetical protein